MPNVKRPRTISNSSTNLFLLEQNFSTLHTTLQYCSRGNNSWIFRIGERSFRWRDFRDVDNCVCSIGHFHVIARGPNFIYTRRKVGARYYLDLLQLGFPLQTRLAWQRLFQRELQRRRFEIFKYLHSIRGELRYAKLCNTIWEIYLCRLGVPFEQKQRNYDPSLNLM